MNLTQTSIQKYFTVVHKGKTYYIDYLSSTGPICGLFNRLEWQVLDEELEELDIYVFQKATKKKKQKIDKNVKLYKKLIKFCQKHFNDFRPNYKGGY